MLSNKEKKRYSRHIMLEEFGIEGQFLLKTSKVLIIGAGGLGSSLIQYLAAAGVGKIGIVDFDKVDDSNLQRQILFSTNDIGKYKAEVAKQKIQLLNPYIKVTSYIKKFSSKNALKIAKKYDLIADGTDNFPTRYLINDTCVLLNIPNVSASIYKFEGQVSVYNFKIGKNKFSPNYRDLYPTPPKHGTILSCGEIGVIGVLPGLMGCIQANEVIKIILKKPHVLHSKILHLNIQTMQQTIFNYKRNNARKKISKLVDYNDFCGIKNSFKSINHKKIKILEKKKNDLLIIDVRNEVEHNKNNKGGINIPLHKIKNELKKIKSKNLILYCKSGYRALKAAELLQKKGRKIWIWKDDEKLN